VSREKLLRSNRDWPGLPNEISISLSSGPGLTPLTSSTHRTARITRSPMDVLKTGFGMMVEVDVGVSMIIELTVGVQSGVSVASTVAVEGGVWVSDALTSSAAGWVGSTGSPTHAVKVSKSDRKRVTITVFIKSFLFGGRYLTLKY
jgi:hypothetical protein